MLQVKTINKHWYPAQKKQPIPTARTSNPGDRGTNAVNLKNIRANRTHAEVTTSPSQAPARIRRGTGAACSGISNPGCFSGSVSSGSRMMPPRAGAGEGISGASTMRGLSTTGSANSSGEETRAEQERGNSLILPASGGTVCSGAGLDPKGAADLGMGEGSGAVSSVPLRSSQVGSAGSNLRRNDGYLGGRGLRRAR